MLKMKGDERDHSLFKMEWTWNTIQVRMVEIDQTGQKMAFIFSSPFPETHQNICLPQHLSNNNIREKHFKSFGPNKWEFLFHNCRIGECAYLCMCERIWIQQQLIIIDVQNLSKHYYYYIVQYTHAHNSIYWINKVTIIYKLVSI